MKKFIRLFDIEITDNTIIEGEGILTFLVATIILLIISI